MIARLLYAVAWLIQVLEWALLLRALASWFTGFPMMQQVYQMLCTFTEPLVAPIRHFLMRHYPQALAPIDFSVLGARLMLELIRILLF